MKRQVPRMGARERHRQNIKLQGAVQTASNTVVQMAKFVVFHQRQVGGLDNTHYGRNLLESAEGILKAANIEIPVKEDETKANKKIVSGDTGKPKKTFNFKKAENSI